MLAGARRLVLSEAGGEQLLGERLQFFELEAVGAVALLVSLLGIVERVHAVEVAEQVVFVVLQAVVAQADGVLDDVIGLALVLLRIDAQIAA